MVSSFISRLVILIFGTLYPAYASYKAVRTKNVKEYVKWMMYWIVFALFTSFETLTDLFLSFWFPFYYELKIITVIYLLSPATNGSSILYRKFVHPVLTQREQEIDEYIAKAKEQGYHTMLNLGSKGVTYATSLIMQTAIKGGGGLVSHLKKSYSLSDLSEEQTAPSKREARDEVDRRYYEDYKAIRGSNVHTPRRMISGSGDPGLYFPEVDTFQRPVNFDDEAFDSRQSAEEISSGYSSGDPVYNASQRRKGDNLVRTASLGGTSRMRTRTSTRTVLPKRASLSEEGSSWSSEGLNESQTETDEYFFLPLSHSSSIPLPLTALNRIIQYECQRMYSGMTEEQIIAFLNSTNLTPPVKNSQNSVKTVDSKSDLQEFSSGEIKSFANAVSVVISEVDNNDEKSQSGIGVHENNLNLTETKESSLENKPGEKEEILQEENLESDKSLQDRSGKYNKKPAPTPPVESSGSKSNTAFALEQDEDVFSTPDSSPKLNRKLSSSYSNLVEQITSNRTEVKTEEEKSKHLEVPKKGKSKPKKLSKKLHFPKMSFSFWNQKTSKLSSGSENSSIASTENIDSAVDGGSSNNKNDLEYFIPLKGDSDHDKREGSYKEP